MAAVALYPAPAAAATGSTARHVSQSPDTGWRSSISCLALHWMRCHSLAGAGATAAQDKVCLQTSSSTPGTIIASSLGVSSGFGNASPYLQNESIPRTAEINGMRGVIYLIQAAAKLLPVFRK